MATFRITSPDGAQYEVNAPEGATEQDAINYVQANQANLDVVPAAPERQPIDRGHIRTMFDQGGQGLTFGFMDEGQDFLGALGAKGYDLANRALGGDTLTADQSVMDLYREARGMSKERLQDEMATRPALSIASNLAGGLLAGGAGATTKTGGALTSSIRSGPLWAQALKGTGAGAASGAAYGFGSADDGARAEGAGDGALVGGVAGGLAPVAGAALKSTGNFLSDVYSGIKSHTPDAVNDFADIMRAKAGDVYNDVYNAGERITAPSSQKLFTDINAAVNNGNFIPELNPKTLSIVKRIEENLTDPNNPGGISLSDLDQYRRMLRTIGKSEDGVSAGAVRKAIDDHLASLQAGDLASGSRDVIDRLTGARADYAKASRIKTVAKGLKVADERPGVINSQMRSLANNEKKTMGWTPEELAALNRAKNPTGAENVARAAGTFGFDLGKTKNVAFPFLTGAGLSAVNPVAGLAVTGLGTAARSAASFAAKGRAQKLIDELIKRDIAQTGGRNLPALLGYVPNYTGQAIRGLPNVAINATAASPYVPPAPAQQSLQNFYQ